MHAVFVCVCLCVFTPKQKKPVASLSFLRLLFLLVPHSCLFVEAAFREVSKRLWSDDLGQRSAEALLSNQCICRADGIRKGGGGEGAEGSSNC